MSVACGISLATAPADAPIGMIQSSSPWMISVGLPNFFKSSVTSLSDANQRLQEYRTKRNSPARQRVSRFSYASVLAKTTAPGSDRHSAHSYEYRVGAIRILRETTRAPYGVDVSIGRERCSTGFALLPSANVRTSRRGAWAAGRGDQSRSGRWVTSAQTAWRPMSAVKHRRPPR